MAPSPDKATEPFADLPNPELNPMMNPILGRHMGRWAQVYFTTVPDKREEAIYDLLRQLKEEEARGVTSDFDASADDSQARNDVVLVCGRCHHQHTRIQNFCGMCGAPLLERALDNDQFESEAAHDSVDSRPQVTPYDTESSDPIPERGNVRAEYRPQDEPNLEGLLTPGLLFDPHHASESRREPSRSMIYADSRSATRVADPPAEAPPRRDRTEAAVDIDWLRDRSLLLEEPPSSMWKLVVVLGILLAVGGFGYVRLQMLRPRNPVSTPAVQPEPSPATEPAPSSSNSPASAAQNPVTETPAPPETANPSNEGRSASLGGPVSQPQAPATANHAEAKPASTRAPLPENQPTKAPPAPALSADNGSSDVAMAENYLSGRNGARNSTAAAQLLWKAVSKQNTAATLILSDLYATGDGVPKSCDQARLLLDAALRKNTPGAANRLQNLQSSCH